jgi:tetratricopeptide (TPR) repeat protein
MKTLIILILVIPSLFAQEYKALKVKGEVKFRSGTSETWIDLKDGTKLQVNDFVLTGEKSSVKIEGPGQDFNLSELSAVSLSSIRQMSTDDLLLALAMEDMINAPKTNGKQNSSNTAVYGDKEGEEKSILIQDDSFGTKRLNGAIQLAKSGYKESAIVFAKETYRKYPDAKEIPGYRIFFADLLFEKGLYEEALEEYMEISKLELNNDEKSQVEKQTKTINQILLNN